MIHRAQVGRSRNDSLTPKIREHPEKHFLGVHQVMESETASVAGIGDDIVVGSEHAVRVPIRIRVFPEFLAQHIKIGEARPSREASHSPVSADPVTRGDPGDALAQQEIAVVSAGKLERVKGIEPSYSAWKAAALPLSYTRAVVPGYARGLGLRKTGTGFSASRGFT
jgi:hypothetical protein